MDKRPRAGRGGKHDHMREEIAERAARLIEEGETDYAKAARKAANQLHVEGSLSLPNLNEIDFALRQRQTLYSSESHSHTLTALRAAALIVMKQFEQFAPWLVGPVLTGTANEHSAIELELIGIEPKRFEMYLFGKQMYYTGPKISPQVAPASAESGHVVSYSLTISGQLVKIVLFENHAVRQRAYPQHHIRHERVQYQGALRRFCPDQD